jgi:hypothetical protein
VFGKVSVNVVRVGRLYDFEKLVSAFVNPAFHGLGHSGWDKWLDGKNPTHVIKFSRRESDGELMNAKRRNILNFKFIDQLLSLRSCQNGIQVVGKRPTVAFDESTKRWLPTPSVSYHLLMNVTAAL